MTGFETTASIFENTLDLDTHPVAVFLLGPGADSEPFAEWDRVSGHRYCQAIMKARRGPA